MDATPTPDRPRVVLVTGGSGLVGRALASVVAGDTSESTSRWVFLSSADCNLNDASATAALFDKHKPTHVVHLAAKVGGLFANMAGNLAFYEENMRM